FNRIADQKRPKTTLETAGQLAASAASSVYAAGAFLNRFLHDAGLKQRTALPAVVLSVGNITVGGTGKTPFCLWLMEFLKEESRQCALISRGYGRDDEDELIVVHDGRRLRATTREAGDEPVMLARALGDVPVIACADRHKAGTYALKKFSVDTIVLDDAFQHHALHRQGDIVLVDSTKRLSSLRLLPRGTLRESPSVLSRAHLIVLTRWNQSKCRNAVLREVRNVAPSVPVVRANVEITSAVELSSRSAIPMEDLAGKTAFLMCAVANPDSVKASVASAGLKVIGSKILPDHDRLTKEQLLKLDSVRRRAGADFLVVTEKDAVKLAELGNLPPQIIALRARMRMVSEADETRAHSAIKSRLHVKTLRGYLR
ncbi:MAG: tetraacyldisaccharide 4'-kinase, partial [Candidatus Sumerlaeota bacterium]